MAHKNPETPRVQSLINIWVDEYKSGDNAVQIAKRHEVAVSTVYRRLKEANILIRTKSQVKLGANNPMWRGDNVQYQALHSWIKIRLPKPRLCKDCKKDPPRDLANISQNYIRSIDDWEWLCRRCHMTKDGRMKNLKQYHEH